jgi:DNA ligase (NAD+)
VRDGVHIFCPNAIGCKPQMVKALAHFASREAMNIEGFGEMTASQLFEELDLRSVDQLYVIGREQLLALDKFKDKKANNLLAAVERSKTCSLDSFIYSLGIPNVGRRTARDLASAFGSMDALAAADAPALLEVPEIGGVTAQAVQAFFGDEAIRGVISRLLEAGVSPAWEERGESADAGSGRGGDNPFAGKYAVATGTLQGYSRREIEDRLRHMGAIPQDNVTKATDFVIAGDKAGSKLAKAQALHGETGKPVILTEAEFEAMLVDESI